ncbi:MAG TPA: hypothetical protein VFJ01_04325, partial [Oleiagrimonas sp.]|nr:hypothetical protein [Oleiagrimonas sp.]
RRRAGESQAGTQGREADGVTEGCMHGVVAFAECRFAVRRCRIPIPDVVGVCLQATASRFNQG